MRRINSKKMPAIPRPSGQVVDLRQLVVHPGLPSTVKVHIGADEVVRLQQILGIAEVPPDVDGDAVGQVVNGGGEATPASGKETPEEGGAKRRLRGAAGAGTNQGKER
jgi:hypothetical protein